MSHAIDPIQEYGYTGGMKVTVEIPDPLYRQVKARAAAEGRTVRDVTVELFERWVEAAVPMSADERRAARMAWLEGWRESGRRIDAMPAADPRSVVQIVLEDRR